MSTSVVVRLGGHNIREVTIRPNFYEKKIHSSIFIHFFNRKFTQKLFLKYESMDQEKNMDRFQFLQLTIIYNKWNNVNVGCTMVYFFAYLVFFNQLYSIHGIYYSIVISVIYKLLPSKKDIHINVNS